MRFAGAEYAMPDLAAELLNSADAYRRYAVVGVVAQEFTHTNLVEAVKVAAEDWNFAATNEDVRVGVVACSVNESSQLDSLSSVEATRAVTKYLAETLNVDLIIGADSSQRTLAVLAESHEERPVVITASATSMAIKEDLREEAAERRFWRTIGSDSRQAEAIDARIRVVNTQNNLILISEAGPYGEGLVEDILRRTTQRSGGGSMRLARFSYKGDFERSRVFRETLNAAADGILVLATSTADDYRALLEARALMGPKAGRSIQFIFPDAGYVDEIYQEVPEWVLTEVTGSRPAVGNEQFARQLANRIDANVGKSNVSAGYAAQALDAGWLSIYANSLAHARYGVVSKVGVAASVRDIVRAGGAACASETPSTAQGVKSAIGAARDGPPPCLRTPLGLMKYDAKSADLGGAFEFWVVRRPAGVVEFNQR